MSADLSLRDFLDELADERGLDLRGYKITTLTRRIRRRMDSLKIRSLGDYQQHIREHSDEVANLLDTVLINVTEFFRDPQAWDLIRRQVLPMLLDPLKPGDTFRAWSAGCATGEEVYSLAILVHDYLQNAAKDLEIKIYATDSDEQALAVARRGEYLSKALRRVPAELRERYFRGDGMSRVENAIRRMVIFGRSNIALDAPIPHVMLVVCRNVLIYFDSATQREILRRLRYALEPGGVLFLGKSETLVKHSGFFEPLNPKWRIFRRIPETQQQAAEEQDTSVGKAREELLTLRAYYSTIFQTLEPGLLVLDPKDKVTSVNDAVFQIWGIENSGVIGSPLQKTALAQVCHDLPSQVADSKQLNQPLVRFECTTPDEKVVTVTVRPIVAEGGAKRIGTLVYMEDTTHHRQLESTVEELQATSEELQSANEELETTNEEMQSTNEELETTNEELQSSNEELETTNEELQSLNEELETTNEELAQRSRELDETNARYGELVERMPWPVLLVDSKQNVILWSSTAQNMFGFATPSEKGMNLNEVGLDPRLREDIIRHLRKTAKNADTQTLRNRELRTGRYAGRVSIHLVPISEKSIGRETLLMFEPLPRVSTNNKGKNKKPARAGNSMPRKNKASKRRKSRS
jgi:two-component system CheB/CheR fusion protein